MSYSNFRKELDRSTETGPTRSIYGNASNSWAASKVAQMQGMEIGRRRRGGTAEMKDFVEGDWVLDGRRGSAFRSIAVIQSSDPEQGSDRDLVLLGLA